MAKGPKLGNVNKNKRISMYYAKTHISHYQSISDSKSENISLYVVSSFMKWNS